MKRRLAVAVCLALGLSALWGPRAGAAPSPVLDRDLVAVSLSELQSRLAAGAGSEAPLEPETPLPLTRIVGVYTGRDGELVLLGLNEGDSPGRVAILPDDIAIAMRSMWLSDQPPGVSIDPQEAEDAPGRMAAFQRVVYFGGIGETRAGLYAFRSDYWMKRLAAGAIASPLPDFETYAQLVLESGTAGPSASRFWFYPREPEVGISPDGDLMVLEDNGVDLLTEAEHSVFGGARSHRLYLGRDPSAERFARSLTSRYEEMAVFEPDLARLRNFFALCQVMKWSQRRGLATGRLRFEDWGYLLHEYRPVPTHSSARVPTVRTAWPRGHEVLMLMGGVSAEVRFPDRFSVDTSGQLQRLATRLAEGWPRSRPLAWELHLAELDPGTLTTLQESLARGRSVAWLRRRAAELPGIAGIEDLGEGDLAVLYRIGQRLGLARVTREGTELLAEDEDAEERFDEIVRDTCRRESDASLRFVHVRRQGGEVVLQVGEEVRRFSVDEVAALFGEEGGDSPIEDFLLEAGSDLVVYRDGRSVAQRRRVGDPPRRLDDPVAWTVALSRRLGDRVNLYLTDHPARARDNRQRVSLPMKLENLVVLVRESAESPLSRELERYLEAQGVKIAQTLEEIPAGSTHLLLISDGGTRAVLDELERLGRRGLLSSKVLMLYTPGARLELSSVDELMDRHGLAGFAHHLKGLSTEGLEEVLRKTVSSLRERADRGKPVDTNQLLGEALTDASVGELLESPMEGLRQRVVQI